MKTQKTSISETVRKCLELILQFKSNQELANSLLIKKTANEFHTTHTKLIELLTELDQSMQEYMKLSVIASSENMSKGVLEQKIIGQTKWVAFPFFLEYSLGDLGYIMANVASDHLTLAFIPVLQLVAHCVACTHWHCLLYMECAQAFKSCTKLPRPSSYQAVEFIGIHKVAERDNRQ